MSLLNSFDELQDAQDNSIEFFLLKMVDLSSNPNFVKLTDFLAVEYDPYSHDTDDDFKFASTRMTWFDKNAGNNNVCISAGYGYGNPTHQHDYYSLKKNFIIFIGTINTGFKKINWDDFETYVTMFRERYGDIADCLWGRIWQCKENGIMRQYFYDVKDLYDVEIF